MTSEDTAVTAMVDLRQLLLDLDPTGADGFEGLVADAVAHVTGLSIRLAKSGVQDGRDGSSRHDAPFAVALEAKLYRDKMRLEDLAGKAVVAGHMLDGRVDLWILCATSEVGDVTAAKLAEVLEDRGVTLLLADWTPRLLPPLAVLLATARDATVAFFGTQAQRAASPSLPEILDAIRAHRLFPERERDLRSELSASQVGIDALRRRSAAWMDARLGDRELSRLSFSQYISVAIPSAPAQPRVLLEQQLEALVTAAEDETCVVALLGGEGAGKTWLVAQWWAALPARPVLIMVAGRRSELLDAADPLTSLARLLADQEDLSRKEVEPWKRRLSRWKLRHVGGALQFVVVLDGLNERATYPWADIIQGLAREVQALGGVLLVTTREAYWNRDVLPRLGRNVAVRTMSVGDYAPGELAAVLATRGRTLDALPPNVREFIRNPRVCAVALDLLDRLDQPVQLTRGRLLFEYWRARIEERGNGLAHTVADFDKLLRAHAKAWLAQPLRTFDRDAWSQFSGAAQRSGTATVLDDLSDIEEGRFLTISPDNPNAYEFRAETLPYALALLTNQELKDQLRSAQADPDEVLDRIIEAVRGFDLVADVVASAVGLACLDEGFPASGRMALIKAWLALQNAGDEAFADMGAHLATSPGAFMDVAELSHSQLGPFVREQSITGLLVYMRDHPTVRAALEARLPRWLGSWSRRIRPFADAAAMAEGQAAHTDRLEKQLALMTASERRKFDALATEVSEPSAMSLDQVATQLMAARPILPFAAGLAGWAMVQALVVELPLADERLSWVLRLNEIDWREAKDTITALLPLELGASEPVREAAAIARRLLGDEASAAEAQLSSPMGPMRKWRRAEIFCDTNPHDPGAEAGPNLSNARSVAASLQADRIWVARGTTAEDHDLEALTPALARFDPQALIDTLRRIISTAASRTDAGLRQLAWRLPQLSPIFDDTCMEAVRSAFSSVLADAERLPANGRTWGVQALVRSLTPHLGPSEQMDVLLRLPTDMVVYLDTERALRPLPAEELDARLAHASSDAGSRSALKRTLFFAGASRPTLGVTSCDRVIDALLSQDREVAALASRLVLTAADAELDRLLLERAGSTPIPADPDDDGCNPARAVAMAVVRRRDERGLQAIPDELLEQAVGIFGGAVIGRLADHVERALARSLKTISIQPNRDVEHLLKLSRDGASAQRVAREAMTEERRKRDLASVDPGTQGSSGEEQFIQRQNTLAKEAEAYERALRQEGAAVVMTAPPLDGLTQVVSVFPARVRCWLDEILAQKNDGTKAQVGNLGLALACAYAHIDGAKAASVFRHLEAVRPLANVMLGDEELHLKDHLLFGVAGVAEFDGLRRRRIGGAMNDAELAKVVLAAELAGAADWLTDYVENAAASELPGDKARALTIAGFRRPNAQSERLLATSDGLGTAFLEFVGMMARKAYRNASWGRTWVERAFASDDRIQFWSCCELAKGVADLRAIACFDTTSAADARFERFSQEARHQIKTAAHERNRKRSDTLFGIKKPDNGLVITLSDRLEDAQSYLTADALA